MGKTSLLLRHHVHRERGFIFSDTEIKTALMVKGIFNNPTS